MTHLLEPAQYLFKRRDTKARLTMLSVVSIRRSRFFHKIKAHFSDDNIVRAIKCRIELFETEA
jgi:predicted transposase YbfD/YdcC